MKECPQTGPPRGRARLDLLGEDVELDATARALRGAVDVHLVVVVVVCECGCVSVSE